MWKQRRGVRRRRWRGIMRRGERKNDLTWTWNDLDWHFNDFSHYTTSSSTPILNVSGDTLLE